MGVGVEQAGPARDQFDGGRRIVPSPCRLRRAFARRTPTVVVGGGIRSDDITPRAFKLNVCQRGLRRVPQPGYNAWRRGVLLGGERVRAARDRRACCRGGPQSLWWRRQWLWR